MEVKNFSTTAYHYYEITELQSKICKFSIITKTNRCLDKIFDLFKSNIDTFNNNKLLYIASHGLLLYNFFLIGTISNLAAISIHCSSLITLSVVKSICLVAEPLIKGLGALVYGLLTLDKEIFIQGLESTCIDVPVSIIRALFQMVSEGVSVLKEENGFIENLQEELKINKAFDSTKHKTYLELIQLMLQYKRSLCSLD